MNTTARLISNKTSVRIVSGSLSMRVVSSPVSVRNVTGNLTLRNVSNRTTVRFPASIPCLFDWAAWADSLDVCHSDNTDMGDGQSANDAGVAIGEYYMTAYNHESAAGGLVKKRLI